LEFSLIGQSIRPRVDGYYVPEKFIPNKLLLKRYHFNIPENEKIFNYDKIIKKRIKMFEVKFVTKADSYLKKLS